MNVKSKTDYLNVDASTQPAAPQVPGKIKGIGLKLPDYLFDKIGKLVEANKKYGKGSFNPRPTSKAQWIITAVLEKLERDEKENV